MIILIFILIYFDFTSNHESNIFLEYGPAWVFISFRFETPSENLISKINVNDHHPSLFIIFI